MYKEFRFESERLIYSGIEKKDAPILVQWRSDPEIIRYFVNPVALSLSEHIKWFEGYLTDKTRYDFMVIHKKDSKQIGFVGINHIKDQSGFINYTIGNKEYRRQGYAAEAVTALCDCFYKQEGIKQFLSQVHKKNISSQKVMKRLKFEKKEEIDGYFIIYERLILN